MLREYCVGENWNRWCIITAVCCRGELPGGRGEPAGRGDRKGSMSLQVNMRKEGYVCGGENEVFEEI